MVVNICITSKLTTDEFTKKLKDDRIRIVNELAPVSCSTKMCGKVT